MRKQRERENGRMTKEWRSINREKRREEKVGEKREDIDNNSTEKGK